MEGKSYKSRENRSIFGSCRSKYNYKYCVLSVHSDKHDVHTQKRALLLRFVQMRAPSRQDWQQNTLHKLSRDRDDENEVVVSGVARGCFVFGGVTGP